MNIYLKLTEEFNAGRLRAIVTSGQAVVLHRLAVMSKDGDWILREDQEALDHVLGVLEQHHAVYRFGAPLDLRWLRHGWSSHLAFRVGDLRVRTDFFTRPPRVSAKDLERLWREQKGREPPLVDKRTLIEVKKTNREKDYAVIGELARLLEDPRDQLLCSRSARDLIALAEQHPQLSQDLQRTRPLLAIAAAGREQLEQALDAERRSLMRVNEERINAYLEAAATWRQLWTELQRDGELSLLSDSHRRLVAAAQGCLPFEVVGGWTE
jgi:hypothetical protein